MPEGADGIEDIQSTFLFVKCRGRNSQLFQLGEAGKHLLGKGRELVVCRFDVVGEEPG